MIHAFFVKTRFYWKDWRSYVAAVNRFFQGLPDGKISGFDFNHCGIIVKYPGVKLVSEYEADYSLLPKKIWDEKNKGRYSKIEVFDITDLVDEAWVRERVYYSAEEFNGYDYVLWPNYASICLGLKPFFPNSDKRLTCSEFLWYLISKERSNLKMPRDIYKYLVNEQIKIVL